MTNENRYIGIQEYNIMSVDNRSNKSFKMYETLEFELLNVEC